MLNRLTDALDKALDNENVQKRLLDLGCIVTDKSQRGPQALSARIRSENWAMGSGPQSGLLTSAIADGRIYVGSGPTGEELIVSTTSQL